MLRQIFRSDQDESIDRQINAVLDEMQAIGVNSEEYPTLLAYLERLHEVKGNNNPEPVSRDTIALIVGNLMGILMIVAYEQKHVMTSKAFTQILPTIRRGKP